MRVKSRTIGEICGFNEELMNEQDPCSIGWLDEQLSLLKEKVLNLGKSRMIDTATLGWAVVQLMSIEIVGRHDFKYCPFKQQEGKWEDDQWEEWCQEQVILFKERVREILDHPAAPTVKWPKKTINLAARITEAVCLDEQEDGCDIGAGLYGRHFSQLVDELAHKLVQD